MPMALRPYLTSFVNICWAAGLFLGSGIVRATLNIEGNLSWRLPYMIQWVWPVPLFIACLFAPESPWYLVRVGKIDEARRAVAKTCTPGLVTQDEIDATVSLMQHTTMLELQESKQQSLTNCFKGTNLRRTEIVSTQYSLILTRRSASSGSSRTCAASSSRRTRPSSCKRSG